MALTLMPNYSKSVCHYYFLIQVFQSLKRLVAVKSFFGNISIISVSRMHRDTTYICTVFPAAAF